MEFVALADGGGNKSDCNSIAVWLVGELAGRDNGALCGRWFHEVRLPVSKIRTYGPTYSSVLKTDKPRQ